MPGASKYEDLELWGQSFELVKSIYALTKTGPFARDFELRDQIRRAAVSTMSNIAEGFSRASRKEFARFVDIARASSQEVQSLLYVAKSQRYVDDQAFEDLYKRCQGIRAGATALIRHLTSSTARS